jgi:glycosyltransferase involved in cell wall biosynthesis
MDGGIPMRVALVHDRLTGMRGGEKVLEVLCELYPAADIYTLVHVPGSVSATIESHRIHTSLIDHLPAAGRRYRHYLPLFPLAIEQFVLDDHDLVISSSHCVAKSVVTPPGARHICYCHTPIRYAWEQFDAYFGPARVGRLKSTVLRRTMAALARWDRATANRPHAYLTNSRYVASRIARYYNRRAAVVYPPVNTRFYHPDGTPPGTYALVVSALAPYKCVDRAIEACRRLGVPLKIVGWGPELRRLRKIAGDRVEFLGTRSDEEIRDLYRGARIVLMPGEEDFGIVPLEAQACGRPVVALGRGGALETVVDGVTGQLVADDSVEALADAIDATMHRTFDEDVLREHALAFSRERFAMELKAHIDAFLTGEAPARPVPVAAAAV